MCQYPPCKPNLQPAQGHVPDPCISPADAPDPATAPAQRGRHKRTKKTTEWLWEAAPEAPPAGSKAVGLVRRRRRRDRLRRRFRAGRALRHRDKPAERRAVDMPAIREERQE
eukprot:gene16959-biopygen23312